MHPRHSPAADSGGSFLVTPEHRADDLDAGRLRHLDVRPARSSRSRASPRRSTSASRRSRSRSTPPSARAREADELLAEYRERLKEAREQADEIVAARAQGRPRRTSARRIEPTPSASARSCWSRRAATSRPRRAARSRRSAREVADLTVAGHREGHAQDARRATTSGGSSRRRSRELDFAALVRRASGRLAHGGDRPGLRALAVRGRQGAGQARRGARAARRSSPTRSTTTASCRCSSSRPTSRPRRRRTGCEQGRRRRRAESS